MECLNPYLEKCVGKYFLSLTVLHNNFIFCIDWSFKWRYNSYNLLNICSLETEKKKCLFRRWKLNWRSDWSESNSGPVAISLRSYDPNYKTA